MIEFVDLLLKVSTVAALFGVVFLLLFFKNKKVGQYIGTRALLFSFIMASVATFGSLFYSEIAQFNPCKLCWFQRIFMYPQMFLLAVATYKKDKKILNYSMVLAVGGFLFAAYHYGLNWYTKFNPDATCPLSGSADCAKAHFTWGFMNIPLMSLTAFSLLLLFYFYFKTYGNSIESSSSRSKKIHRRK